MAASLQRYFAALFFILGAVTLLFLIFAKRGLWTVGSGMILNSLDLPLLGSGMLYAGTSLYVSLIRNSKPSTVLALVIAIPLIILFCVFAWFNFGVSFVDA